MGDLWGQIVKRREGVDYTLKFLFIGSQQNNQDVVGRISLRLSHHILDNVWRILFDDKLDQHVTQNASGITRYIPSMIRQWAHLGMLSYEGYYDAEFWHPAGCYLNWNPDRRNSSIGSWGGWMSLDERGEVKCSFEDMVKVRTDELTGYKSARTLTED